jgi:hypothetical protein
MYLPLSKPTNQKLKTRTNKPVYGTYSGYFATCQKIEFAISVLIGAMNFFLLLDDSYYN